MLVYPEIDPVAFAIGPVKVHWYGLMYVVGFIAGWWLARRRAAAPGLDLEAGRRGRPHFLRCGRRDRRRAPRLDPGLRLRGAARGPARASSACGKAACPSTAASPASWLRSRCSPTARTPRRRRVRLHGAAAGDRAFRGPHRQLHQWRALGQADRPALGHARRTARCCILRSSTKRPSRASCCSRSSGGSRRSRGRGSRPRDCS